MKRIFLLAVVLGAGCWGLKAQTSWSATSLDGNTYRNGNVGIGVAVPEEKLHAKSNISNLRLESTEDNSDVLHNSIQLFSNKISSGNKTIGKLAGYSETTGGNFTERATIEFKTALGHGHYWRPPTNILFKTNGNNVDELRTRMIIDYNGNVGIGTSTPNHILDVAGTIHTQEVKVDMTGWSDFVFHPNYNLRPLQEVNTYIQQNGHLPEIPTATEVKENGISLGEMNAKLLQKIEELTLYTIEQEKRILELEEQNSRIDELEKIIKKIQ